MKLKRIIAGIILTIIFISQVSFVPANSFVYAENSLTANEGKFHYDQLTETAKKIYNGIYQMYVKGDLKTGTQDYDLVENGFFTESQVEQYQKGSSELTKAMSAARYAFYADYPEIFYVSFPKLTTRMTRGNDGKYHIYLGSGKNENYYTEGFSNQKQVESAIQEFDTRVNQIVEGANQLEIKEGQNRQVEQIRYVHNQIIENTKYRLEDVCHEGNEGFLGTPYGVLVKKQAVCEGYSRAFKTILDKLGINCILVQGAHQYSGEVSVAHMWNYVQIEETTARQATGKWYAVDCTQDDPEIYVAEQKDRSDYLERFETYGNEGFENIKYLLVGQITMNDRHFANNVVEAAGDYEFEYPMLEDENYGIDNVANANGISVQYRKDAQVIGKDESGENIYEAEFKVSYKGMGIAKCKEQKLYMLARLNDYDKETDSLITGPWGYLLLDYYPSLERNDYEEYFNYYDARTMYLEFAVTDVAPVEIPGIIFSELKYWGGEDKIIAKTEKIYNENSGYEPPPYLKTATPSQSTTLIVRDKPYHIKAVWNTDLELSEGINEEEIGYKLKCTSKLGNEVTGDKYTKVENITWNGTNAVEFDITFSKMYADDNVCYSIYITGLVGKDSKKAPNPVVYAVRNEIGAVCPITNRGNWNIYGKPTLLESNDLSTSGWETSGGLNVSEKLKDRIALVTTKTTEKQTEKMEQLLEEKYPTQEVVASSTYNITLSICKQMVIKTGQKVKVKVGFPGGYGPEDEGVTYKAYHFKRNNRGEVIGVEEIDCVVTQYGLVITCDSFSPFAIVAVKSDETSIQPQEKSIIATAKEGGTITTKNPNDANIIKLSENESEEISIKADEGYEIESITVCGNTIEVTNKDVMNITVKYEDVQSANNIVNANFVAKSVAQKDEERQEEPVKLTATPAEITMPKNIAITLNKTLKITPTVTETLGVQTYQWYKDGKELEGKTNKVLEIQNATRETAGEYTLKVTTSIETVSADAISEPCTVVVPDFVTAIEKTEISDNKVFYPGENFEVVVKIKDINDIKNGINVLMGQLEYDTNLLEIVEDPIGQNGWSAENGFNEKNFRFLLDNNNFVLKDSEVFKIKFKVKDTVTEEKDLTIKVKNIVASNAELEIPSNDAETTVKVDRTPSTITVKTDATEQYIIEEGFISRISARTTVSQFKANVEATREITIKDKEGNALADTDNIGTGAILQVGDDLQFTLIVIGDIDGNGELGLTDIAKLKLHCIADEEDADDAKYILTGINLRAADFNGNNEVTITDLAQLKIAFLTASEEN